MKHQYVTETIRTADGEVGEITHGSGNVFADMELPDAEDLQFKCDLAWLIRQEIGKRGWTQERAASELAVCRQDVSMIRNNRISRFSIDRLFAILNRLGQRVAVRVSPAHDDRVLLQLVPDAPGITAPSRRVARPSKPTTAIKPRARPTENRVGSGRIADKRLRIVA